MAPLRVAMHAGCKVQKQQNFTIWELLTKLLNQYHLANDDIHGARFQNVGLLSIEDRIVVRPEIVSELRSRNTDHLDSREINDIECRALAMLRDHTLLNPTRNSRKRNKSMPCRRDQHDTRTERSPDRSSNLTGDRNSSDDGSNGPGPDRKAKCMDVERTAPPGHAVRPNRRSARLGALQPCQEKVKRRKHEAHKQEMRKSRRNMTVSTEYKARQDLDEGDADGTELYNEYKRGELLIHGEDTYKKDQTDIKAMNDFVNNTKECEPALNGCF